MTAKTATYIGGPLNGQQVQRRGSVWPIFRDDDGSPIRASKGDREWTYGPCRRFYTRQRTPTPNGEVCVYVHATAWHDWRHGEL